MRGCGISNVKAFAPIKGAAAAGILCAGVFMWETASSLEAVTLVEI